MAVRKRKAPARRTPARRTPAKRTPVRRRTTTRKKGLGSLFTRSEAQEGFNQAIGVGAGFIAGEFLTPVINPDGTKNTMEVIAKIGGGFLASTTGRMPSLGAGIMASGFKKLLEMRADAGMNDKNTNFLNDAPRVIDSGIVLNDNDLMYLSDYLTSYQNQY